MPPLETSVSVFRDLCAEDALLANDNGKNPTHCNFGAIHYSTGEQLDKIVSQGSDNPSRNFIRANRADFRDWLSHNIDVHWGKRFVRYDETATGVRVHFADGSFAEGGILVAADGASSQVRCQTLGADKCAPTAAPLRALSANITLRRKDYGQLLKQGSAFVVANAPDFHFFIGPRAFGESGQDTAEYYWSVCWDDKQPADGARSNIQAASKKKLEGEYELDEALSATKNLHPSLRCFIEKTKPSQMVKTGPQLLQWSPPSSIPGVGVVLIGDALHTMTPFRGAGANTALLDAFDLAQVLQEAREGGRPLCDAKEEYEKIAIPRGQGMVEFSRSAGLSGDPLHWAKMSRLVYIEKGFDWTPLRPN